MTMATATMPDAADIERFGDDGAIVLRGVFQDWVTPLQRGIETLMADPSPRERSYQPDDGSARFFQDLCNWQRIDEFRDFIMNSPAGAIAAAMMHSPDRPVLPRPRAGKGTGDLDRHALASGCALLLRGG